MRYTIDRFETETAVLEDEQGRTLAVPRAHIPPGATEGSVLTATGGGAEPPSRFELDTDATTERLATAQRLRDQLRRGSTGDVDL